MPTTTEVEEVVEEEAVEEAVEVALDRRTEPPEHISAPPLVFDLCFAERIFISGTMFVDRFISVGSPCVLVLDQRTDRRTDEQTDRPTELWVGPIERL